MNFKPILRAQEKKIKDDNNSTKIEELNGWAGHSLNYDDKERNTALLTYLHRLYKSRGGGVLPRIVDRGVPRRFVNPNPI